MPWFPRIVRLCFALAALLSELPTESRLLAQEWAFPEPEPELLLPEPLTTDWMTDTVDQVFIEPWQPMTCNCPQCQAATIATDSTWKRPTLLGDRFGWRRALAENGVSVQADVTHFYQGATNGDDDGSFDYSAHSDLVIRTDFGALGLRDGLSLKIRGEGRVRDRLANLGGSALSPALASTLPTDDAEKTFALTGFYFTQKLRENLAIYAGKVDTLDNDQNAFASGRGKTQFLNAGFVYNPVLATTVPYSTLAAGLMLESDDKTQFHISALSPVDTPTTSGFRDLYRDGVVLLAEARRPTRYLGLPGHHLVGGTWSTCEVEVDPDPRLVLAGINASPTEHNGTWSLYYNFDQYLWVSPEKPHRGWGVFGRAGIADEKTNPVHYFVSIGLGGGSPIATRERDTWGIGYYYLGFSNELPESIPYDNEQGIELYYRAAITRWFNITPDLQIIDGGSRDSGTATILGVRARMSF